MPFKHLVAIFVTTLTATSIAHAVVSSPTNPNADDPAEEQERQDLRAQARAERNLTMMMDESTPEEIAAELGFEPADEAQLEDAAAREALIYIEVSIRKQTMVVRTPTGTLGPWKVSTARRGKRNAIGTFPIDPNRMIADHVSTEYEGSPMPHALFYTSNGNAIHGTDHPEDLGQAASAGCVRLSRANAKKLFAVVEPLVKANGLGSAVIRVGN